MGSRLVPTASRLLFRLFPQIPAARVAGLGYSGIPTSVAVEFDTFFNFGFDDPSSKYIGIDINGSVNSLATVNVLPNFDNGEI